MLANDFGLITQVGRYTWQLAGQNRQLPLSAAELVTEAVSVESLPEPAQAVEKPVEKKLGRKICDLSSQNLRPIPSSSSRFNDSKDIENLPPLDSDSSQKMRANFEALHQAGVRQPALNRLAKLAHVTPELVAGHAQSAPNVRLAIYRIENNWPVPQREQSAEDARRKFVEGEYAEFIHR